MFRTFSCTRYSVASITTKYIAAIESEVLTARGPFLLICLWEKKLFSLCSQMLSDSSSPILFVSDSNIVLLLIICVLWVFFLIVYVFLMNLEIIFVVFDYVRWFVFWRSIAIRILCELAKTYVRFMLIYGDLLWYFMVLLKISFVITKLVRYVVLKMDFEIW